MSLTFRTGHPDDIEICGAICYAAFRAIANQHNFPEDFSSPVMATVVLSLLFSRSDIYPVVAEVDGQIVGSNFLWEGNTIAGVGPISVDPTTQNVGVGKGLMAAVLQRSPVRGGAALPIHLPQSFFVALHQARIQRQRATFGASGTSDRTRFSRIYRPPGDRDGYRGL
jgi:predicted N-acetyltransferase YhbS